jgi:hypothetical protein
LKKNGVLAEKQENKVQQHFVPVLLNAGVEENEIGNWQL